MGFTVAEKLMIDEILEFPNSIQLLQDSSLLFGYSTFEIIEVDHALTVFWLYIVHVCIILLSIIFLDHASLFMRSLACSNYCRKLATQRYESN